MTITYIGVGSANLNCRVNTVESVRGLTKSVEATMSTDSSSFSSISWEKTHQVIELLGIDILNALPASGRRFYSTDWSAAKESDKHSVIEILNTLVFMRLHGNEGGSEHKWADIPEEARRFIIRTQNIEMGLPDDWPVDVDPWSKVGT